MKWWGVGRFQDICGARFLLGRRDGESESESEGEGERVVLCSRRGRRLVEEGRSSRRGTD